MKDVFDSNGYLPLHYIIRRENNPSQVTTLEGKAQKPTREVYDIIPYKCDRYQTNHMILVGIWKPVSNVHS